MFARGRHILSLAAVQQVGLLFLVALFVAVAPAEAQVYFWERTVDRLVISLGIVGAGLATIGAGLSSVLGLPGRAYG